MTTCNVDLIVKMLVYQQNNPAWNPREQLRDGSMPTTFKILLEVEESALGHVMRLLHRTPGVAKFDMLLDKPTAGKANGLAGEPKRTRFRSEVSGADAIIKMLKKKPLKLPEIA